jgi:hypothetical protein
MSHVPGRSFQATKDMSRVVSLIDDTQTKLCLKPQSGTFVESRVLVNVIEKELMRVLKTELGRNVTAEITLRGSTVTDWLMDEKDLSADLDFVITVLYDDLLPLPQNINAFMKKVLLNSFMQIRNGKEGWQRLNPMLGSDEQDVLSVFMKMGVDHEHIFNTDGRGLFKKAPLSVFNDRTKTWMSFNCLKSVQSGPELDITCVFRSKHSQEAQDFLHNAVAIVLDEDEGDGIKFLQPEEQVAQALKNRSIVILDSMHHGIFRLFYEAVGKGRRMLDKQEYRNGMILLRQALDKGRRAVSKDTYGGGADKPARFGFLWNFIREKAASRQKNFPLYFLMTACRTASLIAESESSPKQVGLAAHFSGNSFDTFKEMLIDDREHYLDLLPQWARELFDPRKQKCPFECLTDIATLQSHFLPSKDSYEESEVVATDSGVLRITGSRRSGYLHCIDTPIEELIHIARNIPEELIESACPRMFSSMPEEITGDDRWLWLFCQTYGTDKEITIGDKRNLLQYLPALLKFQLMQSKPELTTLLYEVIDCADKQVISHSYKELLLANKPLLPELISLLPGYSVCPAALQTAKKALLKADPKWLIDFYELYPKPAEQIATLLLEEIDFASTSIKFIKSILDKNQILALHCFDRSNPEHQRACFTDQPEKWSLLLSQAGVDPTAFIRCLLATHTPYGENECLLAAQAIASPTVGEEVRVQLGWKYLPHIMKTDEKLAFDCFTQFESKAQQALFIDHPEGWSKILLAIDFNPKMVNPCLLNNTQAPGENECLLALKSMTLMLENQGQPIKLAQKYLPLIIEINEERAFDCFKEFQLSGQTEIFISQPEKWSKLLLKMPLDQKTVISYLLSSKQPHEENECRLAWQWITIMVEQNNRPLRLVKEYLPSITPMICERGTSFFPRYPELIAKLGEGTLKGETSHEFNELIGAENARIAKELEYITSGASAVDDFLAQFHPSASKKTERLKKLLQLKDGGFLLPREKITALLTVVQKGVANMDIETQKLMIPVIQWAVLSSMGEVDLGPFLTNKNTLATYRNDLKVTEQLEYCTALMHYPNWAQHAEAYHRELKIESALSGDKNILAFSTYCNLLKTQNPEVFFSFISNLLEDSRIKLLQAQYPVLVDLIINERKALKAEEQISLILALISRARTECPSIALEGIYRFLKGVDQHTCDRFILEASFMLPKNPTSIEIKKAIADSMITYIASPTHPQWDAEVSAILIENILQLEQGTVPVKSWQQILGMAPSVDPKYLPAILKRCSTPLKEKEREVVLAEQLDLARQYHDLVARRDSWNAWTEGHSCLYELAIDSRNFELLTWIQATELRVPKEYAVKMKNKFIDALTCSLDLALIESLSPLNYLEEKDKNFIYLSMLDKPHSFLDQSSLSQILQVLGPDLDLDQIWKKIVAKNKTERVFKDEFHALGQLYKLLQPRGSQALMKKWDKLLLAESIKAVPLVSRELEVKRHSPLLDSLYEHIAPCLPEKELFIQPLVSSANPKIQYFLQFNQMMDWIDYKDSDHLLGYAKALADYATPWVLLKTAIEEPCDPSQLVFLYQLLYTLNLCSEDGAIPISTPSCQKAFKELLMSIAEIAPPNQRSSAIEYENEKLVILANFFGLIAQQLKLPESFSKKMTEMSAFKLNAMNQILQQRHRVPKLDDEVLLPDFFIRLVWVLPDPELAAYVLFETMRRSVNVEYREKNKGAVDAFFTRYGDFADIVLQFDSQLYNTELLRPVLQDAYELMSRPTIYKEGAAADGIAVGFRKLNDRLFIPLGISETEKSGMPKPQSMMDRQKGD